MRLLALLLLGIVGCASVPRVTLDQGPVQENLAALEEEVLKSAAEYQHLLDQQGALYQDPKLTAYLDTLLRPVQPPLPTQESYAFAPKIISDPTLNAFALGHGAIYLHTGLIARLTSPGELLFVYGHEMAHVLNRDLLYATHDFRRKTVAAKLTSLVTSPAFAFVGLGGLGDAGIGLVYVASVTGFGREQERAADEEGLRTLQRSGYEPGEGWQVLNTFLAEHERYQRGIEIGFLSSHPSNEERQKTMEERLGPQVKSTARRIDPVFLQETAELRIFDAALNVQVSRSDHAIQELQLLLEHLPNYAKAHYQLAEAYRTIEEDPKKLRQELNGKGWAKLSKEIKPLDRAHWFGLAEAAYQQAIALDAALPDPHRGLGLLYASRGDNGRALQHLRAYLTLVPQARDRRFIGHRIKQLEEKQG